jgi:hypothetical protein
MDEKMIQDIEIVGAVIRKICSYMEKNAWRRVVNHIAELEGELDACKMTADIFKTEKEMLKAELEHHKDAFKVVEAEMLERVPFEEFCEICKTDGVWDCPKPAKQTCPILNQTPNKENEQ